MASIYSVSDCTPAPQRKVCNRCVAIAAFLGRQRPLTGGKRGCRLLLFFVKQISILQPARVCRRQTRCLSRSDAAIYCGGNIGIAACQGVGAVRAWPSASCFCLLAKTDKQVRFPTLRHLQSASPFCPPAKWEAVGRASSSWKCPFLQPPCHPRVLKIPLENATHRGVLGVSP